MISPAWNGKFVHAKSFYGQFAVYLATHLSVKSLVLGCLQDSFPLQMTYGSENKIEGFSWLKRKWIRGFGKSFTTAWHLGKYPLKVLYSMVAVKFSDGKNFRW